MGTSVSDLIQGYPFGGDPNADIGNDELGLAGEDTLRGGGSVTVSTAARTPTL